MIGQLPGTIRGASEDENMDDTLKQRIENLRRKLDGRPPVIEIAASSQLFVTPDDVCTRLVDLAEINDSDLILEPSAGTGAILRAIRAAAPEARCDAVEINGGLCQHLTEHFPDIAVICCDFLQFSPERRYTKIVMNPPFSYGLDIKHVMHALSLLKPGGCLVAVCLNGPRQQKKLFPLADTKEILPRGTFAYTDVSTAIIKIIAD